MHARTERILWMLIASVALLMFVATLRTTGNHLSLERERSAVIGLVSTQQQGEGTLTEVAAR
ncbi:hypothetical protein GeomeDRAFT_0201 [Geobacter metallireducens RCH3]|uniref:Uncharacterized protein n=1 Tax=Geobacter metallireducens (strain ATCC 53774 / DSM 7210 / GS-15) TaxID=269799 RepID=J7LYF0_GEOMG|nr:hypothetical protein [Geobacter metallireducens]AFR42818.1 hypothetical protein Gmet_3600 [Geobacter metallireducens GS-15]EHP89403.1 hypothetical protein GeomeDRAFT_0201 [Geobacter metallireducens RCH3]